MSSINSPNMSLPIPTVGSQPGPDYAINVNTSLTLLDAHDHTPGRGVPITPAAMNINEDLSLNGNSLIDAISLVLSASGSASTTPMSLSAAPGGESPPQYDLWYTPDTGVPIQITKNGIVNATASSIDGESYSSGTFYWTQAQDGLPTTPANFDIAAITLRPAVALTAFGVTLQPASAIASQYSINLPLLPADQKFLTLDQSGNMVATWDVDDVTIEVATNVVQVKNQGITAAKIANNTITTSQISNTAGITKTQLADSAFQNTTVTLTAIATSATVRVATTTNGTFTTAFDNGSPIDGQVLATNDLILIKDQTNAAENGVYVVQASGSPVRATQFDTYQELNYVGVAVSVGTVNGGTSWYQNNVLTSLLDAQSWSLSSTQEWIVPTGINSIRAQIASGGGGGGAGGASAGAGNASGGGGGGGCVAEVSIAVTPGQSLAVTIGKGGAGATGPTIGNTANGRNGQASRIIGTGINIYVGGGAGGGGGIGTAVGSGGTGADSNPNDYQEGSAGGGIANNISGAGAGGPGIGPGGRGVSQAANPTSANLGKISGGGGSGGIGSPTAVRRPGQAGAGSLFFGIGGAGGTGTADAGGGGGGGSALGLGGAGGNGSAGPTAGADGAANSGAGGGGGGADNTGPNGANGGSGANGKVIIYYQRGS